MNAVLAQALAALAAGISVVPPRQDGSKRPIEDGWKRWQIQRPNAAQLRSWYASDARTGQGFVCGAVSGNLELFEFDDRETYHAFGAAATAVGLGELVEQIEAGYLEQSPNGIHWLTRCAEIAGNTKLARRPKRPEEMHDPDDKIKVLIETRGEGGYAVAAPSHGTVHPSGKSYLLLRGGPATIPTITPDERRALWSLARTFDGMPESRPPSHSRSALADTAAGRPGDDFNRRATWAEVLQPHGWTAVHQRDGTTYWRRPGTESRWSASTNYQGSDLFYPWTTSTPFEAERGYSRFAVYAILAHGGDFKAAATDLARRGYGVRAGAGAAVDDLNAQGQAALERLGTLTAALVGGVRSGVSDDGVAGGFVRRGGVTRPRPAPPPRAPGAAATQATPSGSALRRVVVSDRFLREISAEILEELERLNQQRPVIFRRAGILCRLVETEDAHGLRRPEIADLRHVELKGVIDRVVDCVRERSGHDLPARPPDDVVADILALRDPRMPRLRGILEAPTFLPDGRLLTADGYDAASGFYVRLGGLADLRADMAPHEALGWLAVELLGDFPFDSDASRAHAIGLFVERFARPLISGPTPLRLIEAPLRGSGKGLLADLVSIVATGRPSEVMGLPHSADEQDKRVTSLLLKGAPFVLLDNVRELASATLEAVLTSSVWTSRVLGQSRMVSLPNDATWLATANNPRLSDEMLRRAVSIRLDPKAEHPEERTGFRHALPAWAIQHRRELISASLSLVRAWLEAGRPRGSATLGRFEDWAETMGGILQFAGVPGFLKDRAALRARGDRDSQEWIAFCQAWWGQFGDKTVTAGVLLKTAVEQGLLVELRAGRSELGAQQRLGRELAARRDRKVGRLTIRATGHGTATGSAGYHLEPDDAAGPTKTPKTTGATPDQEGSTAGIGDVTTAKPRPQPQNQDETTAGRGDGGQIGQRAPAVVPVVFGVFDHPTPANARPCAAAVGAVADPTAASLDRAAERSPAPPPAGGKGGSTTPETAAAQDPRSPLTLDGEQVSAALGLRLGPAEIAPGLLGAHPEPGGMDHATRRQAVRDQVMTRPPSVHGPQPETTGAAVEVEPSSVPDGGGVRVEGDPRPKRSPGLRPRPAASDAAPVRRPKAPPWRCVCSCYEREYRPEWGDWVCSGCGMSAPAPDHVDGGRP